MHRIGQSLAVDIADELPHFAVPAAWKGPPAAAS
jgi:hypothetical protein